MKHFEELAFKAGFTGSDLSNTQFGTSYKHALQNFMELIIEDCVLQCFHNEDAARILNHFGMLIEDEELEADCPCGFDGGTTCGAVNCEY